VPVDHVVLGRIDGPGLEAIYLPVDAPALDALRHQRFRVRFQMRNTGADPITAIPRLEYRADGAAGFAVVPEGVQPGIALRVAREWIPSPEPDGGTMQGPLGQDIAAGDLRIPSAVGVPAVGHHSMGINPDAPITLPAGSYTEEEFTVLLTAEAQYLTGYELRITNGGAEMPGTQVARIVVGPQPPVQPSVGDRQGVPVDDPAPTNATDVAYPLLSAPTIASETTQLAVAPAASPPSGALYPLASGSLSAATVDPSAAVAAAAAVTVLITPPGTYGLHEMGAAQCGTCHRGHTAKGPNVSAQGTQSTLCFTCHSGVGAAANVQSQYTDPLVPQNDKANRLIYRHDTDAPSTPPTNTHTRSELDEFGGLSNRHSGCADCHNSHRAKRIDSTQTATGWTASGRQEGVSGVSVLNGAAGTAPTYTFLSGVDTDLIPANKVTREYQLCFKCHSGSTILDSNAGFGPSRYRLDKAVEFNPNNPSYHPVEAAGKNTTPNMAASLAGVSPYKQWNFTTSSTIRCVNCHASSAKYNLVTPPSAGGDLPVHTSKNPGILLQNYRNRVLKPVSEGYRDVDFALCYMCHAKAPFATETGTATNFSFHGYHLTKLTGQGSANAMIDTPGAGGGNAICAECHFRQHSTTYKNATPAQTIPGSRLVSFAPNVQPNGGTLNWTSTGVGRGSCTLTCHGKSHTASGEGY